MKSLFAAKWIVALGTLVGVVACSGGGCTGDLTVTAELLATFEGLTEGQVLTQAQDTDPVAPGLQMDVVVNGSDSRGREITLSGAKLEVQTAGQTDWTEGPVATIEGSQARFASVTLPANASALRATLYEEAREREGRTTINLVVQADVTPPVLRIEAPVAGRFTSVDIPVRIVVEGGDSLPVQLRSELTTSGGTQSVPLRSLTVTDGVAEGTVSFPEGTQALIATTQDAAGNVGTARQEDLLVDVDGCGVLITNPAQDGIFGAGSDLDSSTAGLQYELRGVAECPERPVTVTLSGVSGEQVLQPDSMGAFAVTLSLPDGETTTVTAAVDDGNVTRTDSVAFTVDLVAPSVSLAGHSGSTLYVVAPTNIHLSGSSPEYVADESVSSGAQVSLSITTAGGAGGVARFSYQGTSLGAPVTVVADATPQSVSLVFPDNSTGDLVIEVQDVAGNISSVTYAVTVDVTAPTPVWTNRAGPTLFVVAATNIHLGSGSPEYLADADPTPEAQVTVALAVAGASGGNARIRYQTSTLSSELPLDSNTWTQDVSVVLADNSSGTLVLEAEDAIGNRGGTTFTTQVDVSAPVSTLASISGTDLFFVDASNVHVDVSAPHYIVDASPSAGAQATLSVTVAGASGGHARVLYLGALHSSELAPGSNAWTQDVSVVLEDNSTGPLVLEAEDAIGNRGTTTFTAQVDVSAPMLAWSGYTGTTLQVVAPTNTHLGSAPPYVADASTDPGAQVAVPFLATDALGGKVRVLYQGTPAIADLTPDSNSWLRDVTVVLADGSSGALQLEVEDAIGNHASVSFTTTVDVSAPALSLVGPTGAQLYFVAPTNGNLGVAHPEYLVDENTTTTGAQSTVRVRVVGGNGGHARVLYRAALVGVEQNLNADTWEENVGISLAHDTTGTLLVQAEDVAGNRSTLTYSAAVDVVAPAAPVTVEAAVQAGEERQAKVDVTWTSSGDDDTTGTLTGFDIRWSPHGHLPAFETLFTNADYFNPSVFKQEGGGLLPPTQLAITLEHLPAFTRYHIHVRAVDELGNYSTFAPSTVILDNQSAPTAVFTTPDPTPTSSSPFFGNLVASGGDFNGDGFDDLVASAANYPGSGVQSGRVYVYYGRTDFTQAASDVQVLSPPVGTASQQFGIDMSVGDVSGDLLEELVVGASAWNDGVTASRGRAFLYFGAQDERLSDTNRIEFRGTHGVAGLFGIITRIIPDINGDGMREVVITATGENGGNSRVYLFYGRNRAGWDALRSEDNATVPAPACSTTCVILASKADRIFLGDAVGFGRRRGFAVLGDVDGNGTADFAIPNSRVSSNRLTFYAGETVNAGSTGASFTTADTFRTQVSQAGVGTTTSVAGFSSSAFGNVSLLPGGDKHLAVTFSNANKLFIYSNTSLKNDATPVPVATLSGTRNFATSLDYGDINLDGQPDLAITENETGVPASIWVFFNRPTVGGFDSTAQTGFYQSRLSSRPGLGVSVAIGDFNNDGRPDIAGGTIVDTTAAPGVISVWQ